jgi:hypothetical protein
MKPEREMSRSCYRWLAMLAMSGVLASCGDALIYGEGTKFNLEIGVNSNPAEPVMINAGLQRIVVNYAPPAYGTDPVNGVQIPNGEAVSSMSNFLLTDNRTAANPLGGTLEIITQFASGQAARSVAGSAAAAVATTATSPAGQAAAAGVATPTPAVPAPVAAPVNPLMPIVPPSAGH